ncbi:MAG: hypothetical protein ACKOWK_00145, partial [Micrococcales bacterium]
MKQTKVLNLLLIAVAAGIAGAGYGVFVVSHGFALPVAKQTTLVTMPVIGVLLFLISLPVIRHRAMSGQDRVWVNLSPRHQHEGALVGAGVRQGQLL